MVNLKLIDETDAHDLSLDEINTPVPSTEQHDALFFALEHLRPGFIGSTVMG